MEYRYTEEAQSYIEEYELQCSACNKVCNDPIICPKGHDHCRTCIISVSAVDSDVCICPTIGCNAMIDLNNLHSNQMASKMIDNLKIYCPNRDIHEERQDQQYSNVNVSGNSNSKRKRNVKFTAPSMVTPSKSKALVSIAPPSPQSILHDPGCLWEGSRKNLIGHLDECPYVPVSCGFIGCHVRIPRKKLIEHEETCEHGHTKCPKCDEDLINKPEVLVLHPNECPKEIVECSIHFCHFMCARQDMKDHCEDEQLHQELMANKLIQSNQLIANSKINPEELNPHEIAIYLQACIDSNINTNLNSVLQRISVLCGNDNATKVTLGELGACEAIVSMLKQQLISDAPNVELIEGSCCAISSLCCNENRSKLQSVGACDVVSNALSLYERNENIVAIGCNAVGNLSHLDNAIKATFGNLNVCEAVVGALLKFVDDNEDIVVQACGAISNLSSSESNRLKFCDLDVIDLLEHAKNTYPNHPDIVKWCSKCILRFTVVNTTYEAGVNENIPNLPHETTSQGT